MKLFTKYNRISLATTIGIFLLSGVAFYFLLHIVLLDEVDNNLKIEQKEIETYILKYNKLPETIHVKNLQTSFTATNNFTNRRRFRNVSMPDGDHSENARQLSFIASVNNRAYEVAIVKSLEETEDLVKSIIIITLSTILLILAATVLINRVVLTRLWQPFYSTLTTMKQFRLGQQKPVHFEDSNIEEFALMNKTLREVAENADKEYILLKEFTENASHELQTPLAVIRTKLDLLIQDETLTETQARHLQGAYDAVSKMSKLNQSLLLLTKIENRQFHSTEEIDLKEMLFDKLQEINELLEDKNLTVTPKLADAHICMNTVLCEILFNNLLANSIKHNLDKGCLVIDLSHNKCIISNSGASEPLDSSRIFNRFYTSQFNTDHHGLGLAIIKQICDTSGINISYNYQHELHTFELSW